MLIKMHLSRMGTNIHYLPYSLYIRYQSCQKKSGKEKRRLFE